MKTAIVIAALAIGVGSAVAADVAAVSSGPFKSRDFAMYIKSAIAFRGSSMLDKTEAIIVAITNAEMDIDGIGAYRGLDYYFARGNGCGYCGGGVTSA